MRPFWIISAAILVTILVIRGFFHRHRQKKQLAGLAHRHKLNYVPEDLMGILKRFSCLQLLNVGHNRRASQVIYGSTNCGLITLFHFSCEIGFGVNRTEQQWWMAVVETSHRFKPWRAYPIDFHQSTTSDIQVGHFHLHTGHADTLERLREAGLYGWLEQAPPCFQWEAHGPLIAAAGPGRKLIDVPEQLLESVFELSRYSLPQ